MVVKDKCTRCGLMKLVTDSGGFLTCSNCGLIIKRNIYEGTEWRNFSNDGDAGNNRISGGFDISKGDVRDGWTSASNEAKRKFYDLGIQFQEETTTAKIVEKALEILRGFWDYKGGNFSGFRKDYLYGACFHIACIDEKIGVLPTEIIFGLKKIIDKDESHADMKKKLKNANDHLIRFCQHMLKNDSPVVNNLSLSMPHFAKRMIFLLNLYDYPEFVQKAEILIDKFESNVRVRLGSKRILDDNLACGVLLEIQNICLQHGVLDELKFSESDLSGLTGYRTIETTHNRVKSIADNWVPKGFFS
eukprot:TRINITY_DN2264_c0_g3_i1.p1 TRINITY_DN2264_c0_g3~~TRINITY_DN2264_c0_g3_i1.p1  ORF type:complete len:303 (-),score=70.38 TRINITY_DN2264_c0_g3_i1:310-1218(-)